MATSAGVGFSEHRNPVAAGKEAAMKALEQAGIAKPDFVFVFATVGYNQQSLIRSIREATSGAPLSGCSGEGIITRETVAETNFGVAVMVISSNELRFNNGMVKGVGERAGPAGELLASEIRPFLGVDNIACFLLADGLVFNFDPFLSAFETALRRDGQEGYLPLFGGLAADNWASKKTFQYHDDEVFSEGLSFVVMSGSGGIASGVNHGCVPVGSKRTITRSLGNIIYEIDGVPALEALQDYLGDDWRTQWNKTSLNLCLGFKTPETIKSGYEEYIIRYMMGMNDKEGWVTIQSEVCEGTELWIVRRDKELINCGMRAISSQIREQLAGRIPKFVLQFECVGRGKVVFREQEKIELIRGLQQEVGEGIPWIGFYTYGEIGPVVRNNCFHNFTSVVTAVY
ncbi:MAG: FIST C-terminal domain-containing protein [Proteobacteria bacterium]|nr:FIST C-terminal domain-containing protein [Pseudomonadota bacterium]MBU4295924.1 FIST C-terminal domain-containing protein [Pseudomonadota bacterium]MCG2746132.1 FIST C-terminal domain-containing protein [Desulfobulbaceae bacterium]